MASPTDTKSPKKLQERLAASEWIRLPVSPETVTVLGRRVNSKSASWRGLNFSKADLLAQATLMMAVCGSDIAPFDYHLRVPFCHPDDQTGTAGDWTECFYRVRPRMKPGKLWEGRMVETVFFERVNGEWRLAVALRGAGK